MIKVLLILLLIFSSISPEVLRAEDFSVSVGSIALSRPDYEGSDESEFDILPLINISMGKSVFLNTERGLGVYLMKNRDLEFGGSLGYYEARDEDDSQILNGLGDIDGGFDGRVFAKLNLERYSLSLQLQTDITGNHDGTLLIVGAGYSFGRHTDVDWNVKASMTFADDNYMQSYFGITTAKSGQSGITAYNADGGLKDLALVSNISRRIDRHWSLKGVVGYKQLLDDAGRSPLVRTLGSEHQFQFGVGVAYKF